MHEKTQKSKTNLHHGSSFPSIRDPLRPLLPPVTVLTPSSSAILCLAASRRSAEFSLSKAGTCTRVGIPRSEPLWQLKMPTLRALAFCCSHAWRAIERGSTQVYSVKIAPPSLFQMAVAFDRHVCRSRPRARNPYPRDALV